MSQKKSNKNSNGYVPTGRTTKSGLHIFRKNGDEYIQKVDGYLFKTIKSNGKTYLQPTGNHKPVRYNQEQIEKPKNKPKSRLRKSAKEFKPKSEAIGVSQIPNKTVVPQQGYPQFLYQPGYDQSQYHQGYPQIYPHFSPQPGYPQIYPHFSHQPGYFHFQQQNNPKDKVKNSRKDRATRRNKQVAKRNIYISQQKKSGKDRATRRNKQVSKRNIYKPQQKKSGKDRATRRNKQVAKRNIYIAQQKKSGKDSNSTNVKQPIPSRQQHRGTIGRKQHRRTVWLPTSKKNNEGPKSYEQIIELLEKKIDYLNSQKKSIQMVRFERIFESILEEIIQSKNNKIKIVHQNIKANQSEDHPIHAPCIRRGVSNNVEKNIMDSLNNKYNFKWMDKSNFYLIIPKSLISLGEPDITDIHFSCFVSTNDNFNRICHSIGGQFRKCHMTFNYNGYNYHYGYEENRPHLGKHWWSNSGRSPHYELSDTIITKAQDEFNNFLGDIESHRKEAQISFLRKLLSNLKPANIYSTTNFPSLGGFTKRTSQFIHIPNYGKRKIRYQKNGRPYVIVNKKKLKL